MSIYRAKIYAKGNCLNEVRFRYQRFWGAKKDKLMVFATTLNLTNVNKRCHRALPLDDEDCFVMVSPYDEDYLNGWYHTGYRPMRDGWDKRALTCMVMR